METVKTVKDFILPTRIVLTEGNVENVECLTRAKEKQIGLAEADLVKIVGKASVILDFGSEYNGGVRILTFHAGNANCPVRVRFGESLTECCSEIGEKGSTNDHSLRDLNTNLVNFSDATVGATGFRFVRLDFFGEATTTIKNIYAAFEHADLERKGWFECSDKRVNEIYNTAARTVELCIQNGMVWDGIKRDRLVWIGDMHTETLSLLSMFGAVSPVKNSLDFVRGQTPLPAFMNHIPAYSLWWLLILGDYYLYTGDEAFLKENQQYVEGLVKVLDEKIGTDGRLDFSRAGGDPFFFDWPTVGHKENESGVNALFTLAIKKTEVVYDALGMDKKLLTSMQERILKTLPAGQFKQVEAMRVLAGHTAAMAAGQMLKEGGAKGVCAFLSYYILSALTQAGEGKAALDIMKQYFGAMLDIGATTFFEDFDIEWLENSGRIDSFPEKGQKDIHGDFGAHCYKGFRHSFCHGWSSGAVPFLTQTVLGLTPAAPGCRKMTFAPDLLGLDWAKGVLPTPYGAITVSLKNENGTLKADISAPKEIEIIRK